jgi:hypothetical protein
MTTSIKRRRGTTAQTSVFTGAVGETTVDTTKQTVVVHDGLTAGGFPLATETNLALKANKASPTFTGTVSGITATMVGAPSGSGASSGTNTGDQTNISGNAATVTTNANLTGAITSSGNAASLGSFTSAQLAGALTDETGSGASVFATSPTLVTPALGTPSALVGTNITGTAASLSIGGNSATATSLAGLVGTAPSYSARAWVNFNGTGTVAIRASGNVSSITDNGVGNFTLNFAAALPDANYVPTFGAPVANDNTKGTIGVAGGYNTGVTLKTTTQLNIQAGNANGTSLVDFIENNVAVFR